MSYYFFITKELLHKAKDNYYNCACKENTSKHIKIF